MKAVFVEVTSDEGEGDQRLVQKILVNLAAIAVIRPSLESNGSAIWLTSGPGADPGSDVITTTESYDTLRERILFSSLASILR
jgi:hypothetical protein